MLILRFLRSQATQRDTIADLVGSSELADQYIQAKNKTITDGGSTAPQNSCYQS